MIVLLGASGYVGEAFAAELRRRKTPFTPLARKKIDYTNFSVLADYLRSTRPEFLVNAAGFTGRPNVDACESARDATLQGNTLLPLTVAHACAAAGVPWGHVSSGCIYSGAKVRENGVVRHEKDLMTPEMTSLRETHPESLLGFTETDAPNFCFGDPPCSFYSGTKALAETALAAEATAYIWRLRIPFDQFDNPRNLLTKLQRYPRICNSVNSISHRMDFAKACLDCWEKRVPFGVYNVTNPGYVTAKRVVEQIRAVLKPARSFEFWASSQEFEHTAKAPRSNCILDVSKLLATGVALRPVEDALMDALKNWTS